MALILLIVSALFPPNVALCGEGRTPAHGPQMDVRAYGAAGDGITDDTAAIQKVFNTTPNGAAIFFPDGRYRITSALTFDNKHKVRLYGNGKRAALVADKPDFNMLVISGTSTDNVIEGISFQGASVALERSHALNITGDSVRNTIRCCSFSGVNVGIAIRSVTADENIIEANEFTSIIGSLTGNGYAVYTISQKNIIRGNVFRDVGRHDVYLSGSKDGAARYNVVVNNVSERNKFLSIVMNSYARQVAVSGNMIEGNTIINPAGGISCSNNCKRNIINGNLITEATGISIYMNGSIVRDTHPDDNVITNNAIVSGRSELGDIRCINASRLTINKNLIKSSGLYGIVVAGTGTRPDVYPSNNVISGNTVIGATKNSITAGSIKQTGVVVSGNITDIPVSVTAAIAVVSGNVSSLNGTH